MSKAIHSMEVAFSSGGAPRTGAGRRSGGDEAGGFSRLLSAGRAEQAERAEGQSVPESGRKLPDRAHPQSGGAGAERDTVREAAPAAAVPDSGRAMPDQPAETAAGPVPATSGTTGHPVELPGLLAGDTVTAPVAGVTIPDVSASVAGPEAEVGTPGEPASPPALETGGAPVPDAQDAVETGGLPVPNMPHAVVTEPLPQAAAAGIESARAQPEGHRGRPAPDPVAQAVREGMVQPPAAPTAQGNGGEQTATGDSRQSALPEASPATVRSNAAGVIPFSDTLIEAGSSQPSARVPVAVGQPGWGRAVGEQVVWFVSQNIQTASLRLNPQHLGPLELQLNLDGDRASIAFTSQHAAVREALETSLPRLRDMFAEQGLNLVNVNVSQQDGSRREQRAAGGNNAPSAAVTGVDEPVPLAAATGGPGGAHGLVDYYV